MIKLTRSEGHLLAAAVRVLVHRLERSPTPEEVSDLLEMSASAVRMRLVVLQDLGAVALVESAFEVHVEVRDLAPIEALSDEAGPAITDDLKEFDRRKREEADKMADLFESGAHDQQQREHMQKMDEDLQSFRRKKPANPFGED